MGETNDDLKIQTPCHMKWAELQGDGAKRWCDQCSLHVVDGASLTRDEAKEMVSKTEDRVCMRIVRDESGRVVHKDDEVVRSGVMGRVLRFGLTAAAGALVACGDEAKDSDGTTGGETGQGHVEGGGTELTPRPPEIMGEVCFPEEMGDVVCPDPGEGETEQPVPHEIMGAVAPIPPPETKPEEPVEDTVGQAPPREIVGRVAHFPEPTPSEPAPDETAQDRDTGR